MGRVFLGLPGRWASDNRERSDHRTTKVGGLPDWPFPREALAPHLLECRSCGSKLYLVAQVYAPIASGAVTIEDRLLLIFGCLALTCGRSSTSWRALRVQRATEGTHSSPTHEEQVSSPRPISVSKTNWLEDEQIIDLQTLTQAFAETESLSSSSSSKTSYRNHHHSTKILTSIPPNLSELHVPVFPCFYVYLKEEPESNQVTSICSSCSVMSIEVEQDSKKEEEEEEEEDWEREDYEYDQALTVDRTYLKLKKRLDANPNQCFRYSYQGNPLLARKEIPNPGRCTLCCSLRHFEMQLMPPLIYFLGEGADDQLRPSLEAWNWITTIIYTCSSVSLKPQVLPWLVTENPKFCFVFFCFVLQNCSQETLIHGSWVVAEEAMLVQLDDPILFKNSSI